MGGQQNDERRCQPECVDDTDVVAFRKCSKFGASAKNMRLPRIYFELGSNVRQFGSD